MYKITFQDEKVKLKENLICEFEDKRTHLESERTSIELSGNKMNLLFTGSCYMSILTI